MGKCSTDYLNKWFETVLAVYTFIYCSLFVIQLEVVLATSSKHYLTFCVINFTVGLMEALLLQYR